MCDDENAAATPTVPVEKVEQPQHINLSFGSGLTIVGIWLMSTSFTVFWLILTLTDVLMNNSEAFEDFHPDGLVALMILVCFLLITSLPSIVAHHVTTMILGKDK